MSDKELIKQEIERRIKNLEFSLKNNCVTEYSKLDILGNITTLESLLKFINSLPEESGCEVNFTTKNEDLEKEIENYINDSLAIKFPTTDKEQIKADIRYIAHHFAEWQKQKDLEDLLKSDMTMPNKFYEKGKADAINEMKEALQTEYEKGRFDMREEMMKDAIEVVVTNTSFIPLPKMSIKAGDKVKIIIVKED